MAMNPARPPSCLPLIAALFFGGLLISPREAAAQQPWNFASVEEMCIADAYLPALPDSLKVLLEQAVRQPVAYNIRYHLSGPHSRRGRDYVLFQAADDTSVSASALRVPLKLVPALMPHLVSCRYWERRFTQLLKWSYIDMPLADSLLGFDTLGHRYGRYSPLHLLTYTYTSSPQSPVVFSLTTNSPELQQLTLQQLQQLAEAGAFATEADLLAYERLHRLRTDRDRQHLDSLDALIDSLTLRSSRFARQADSLELELEADSLELERQQRLADVERTKQRMNRDAIFIINLKPARSEYMFGLELNLYNCFPRTIASIELTVTPYNNRGQVQKDKFKRSARTMRCVGPIEPGHPAQYTFDELFWDDRGHIKFMRLTAITFRFTDGTRRSYYGYAQILKHSLTP